MKKLHLLDSFASSHHGLINFGAAAERGVSRATWHRLIVGGYLDQLYPNVARLWGSPPSFEQRALAAVWAAGPGAMASHRTSAALWGVERPADDDLDVILPRRGRHSLPPGVQIHRPRDVHELRPIMRNKVPTTSPMRMLLDLGAVDEGAVGDALQQVVASRVVSPKAVYAFLIRHAKQGRHGVTALRTALEDLLIDGRPSDTELEQRMAVLLREHGLPRAEFHAVVEGFEVDFHIVGSRLIIECDGWATHGLDRDQFEFDRYRTGELVAGGYVVIGCTWRQVVDQPEKVARRIRRAIETWAPELLAHATGARIAS